MTSPRAAIRGLVIDSGGKPVDGAAVAIVDGPGSWPDIACLTGADGRFVLGTPSTGRYKLGVRSDGHDYTEAVVAIEGNALEGNAAEARTIDVTIEVGSERGPEPGTGAEEETT